MKSVLPGASERTLGKLTRGFTDLGVVKGWWQGQTDWNRLIVMIVNTEREVDGIREFLQRARIQFRQQAMYLDYHPTRFEEVQ